jgi:hypothetical protein
MIASTSSIGGHPIQRPHPTADTQTMHVRRERVRIETQRHEIEGTVQLPSEGYRSRTTDFLNAHDREFLALTDVEVRWLDGSRAPERHEYLAVALTHIVLVFELETLGIVDEAGGVPEPAPLMTVSTPPPLD